MTVILITGPAGSGKSSIAYGLLALARDAGRSAAYCKAFSAHSDNDADCLFASEELADAFGIAVGPQPVAVTEELGDTTSAIADLARQSDIVVVEIAEGSPAVELAQAIDASVVEVLPYAAGRNWANAVDEAAVRWGNRLSAIVINSIPLYRQASVSESAARSQADVDAVVLPESRVMVAPTVAQIGEWLGAAWTQDPVNEHALVERYLIGGNIMDNGPTYYGRYNNQAVITRTQRPDIQLASMLPQTRCLLLTGPGEPAEYVKAEARERDIPLLQVSTSTVDTADALGRLLGAATPHNLGKVHHFAAFLVEHASADWIELLYGQA